MPCNGNYDDSLTQVGISIPGVSDPKPFIYLDIYAS